MIDEQFYLLVGDRMWHGDLPYVDIWDRKPIGLFLIYAILRWTSADGIVGYQIGALVAATATAFVIARIASRFASAPAATLAGLVYLIYTPIMGGAGGQSPIFYNLPMACAALVVVKATEFHDRRLHFYGALAMALVGIALQIKYSAVVEGVFFGLYLLWLHWRAQGHAINSIGFAALLALCALLPTGLAAGYYIYIGHGTAFALANFISIFKVHEPAGFSSMPFLIFSAMQMMPLLLVSTVALVVALRRPVLAPLTAFVCIWCGFAFAGFFVIGHFYSHYALPMLVPLALLNVALLRKPVWAGIVVGTFAAALIGGISTEVTDRHDNRARIAAMVEVLSPAARRGCIYLNDGPAIVYLLTQSCLPTPYVFPEHLNIAAEAEATNATVSMAALIARRPSAIVLANRPLAHPLNRVTAEMLAQAVAADYHLVATLPDIYGTREQRIYFRNDLATTPR